jgi:hypothetical protein
MSGGTWQRLPDAADFMRFQIVRCPLGFNLILSVNAQR